MKIQSTSKAVDLLVGDRPAIQKGDKATMFCTISPNPNTLHPVYKTHDGKRISVKMPYGRLPQAVQYQYCMRIVERCYIPFLSEDASLIGTWELNKTGNVHFHMLIQDDCINNKTHIEIFRRNILNCEDVIKNMAKGKKMTDWMNNIVYVNKPIKEIVEYMDKDFVDNSFIKDMTNYHN